MELLILTSVPGILIGVDRNGIVVWTRNDFGADGQIVKSCGSGVIADVQDWEGQWRSVRVAEIDRSDLATVAKRSL